MSLNCDQCPANCCGVSPVKAPVLLPSEEGMFLATEKRLSDHGFYRIPRSSEGTCIFLRGRACSIYDLRPLECQLYPYVLKRGGELALHEGCPSREHAAKPEVPGWVKELPAEFWDRWERLTQNECT